MSTRRRFTGEFKAKVALEALRGDKTIQEIAVRHSHPTSANHCPRHSATCRNPRPANCRNPK